MTSKRKGATLFAVLTAGALALTACGGDDGGGSEEPGANRTEEPTEEEGTQSGTITVAVDSEYTAYNDLTAEGNGTWNTYVHNGAKLNFWSYGADGSIVREEEFGTYEKTSDDPLTVEYTYSDKAVWSDGEPIDCDDFLLEWAAMSGKMVDGSGEDIFDQSSTNGYELVQKPECQPGDKTITVVYEQPYIDWELIFQGGAIPAHIAAEQGGLTSEELITAIAEDDIAALKPVAKFWNTGWQFNPGELPPPEMIPSSGPYLIDSWDAGQSLTLKANPNFYGTPPKTETIVLRLLDPAQQVAALQNGEVDIINPGNPTPDVAAQLEQLAQQGQITTESGESLTWSHIDMQQGKGDVFEPLEIRQAFAKCIPRQLIVDNLVKPANPEAIVLDMREFFPVDPMYDQAREQAFPADMYGEQDLDGARQLIQQSGVQTPIDVRLMHADDPVRNQLSALVKSECDKVGFNIKDFTPPDWGARLTGQPGSYDATMFAWAGSGVLAAGESLYVSDGAQNPYGYANQEVDKLWDQIVTSTDREAAKQLIAEMEGLLWEDVFNIPLYVNANINAFASDLEGVKVNATQTGVTFNMDEWSRSS
ncbi:peptide/nickel transport system substrate-binding protein [Haloactinopolyspora alba]|uniref:Peptide/nickel transport system substrate-binding protein n=1 Tax=Haloactinopolyspora alba TaxID=648780 RepID=A0A2P8DX70_9ACTN|nr:ABC transporter family substrate-binding protein [Haloactinopolyspora alba]PSL01818.1 peptide/nickel transport system substrate-binding protein [Haloactinopolyspora alba]